MESSPASTLVVVEADLLLQVLEVALDAPSELGGIDECRDRCAGGQRRKPVLGWGVLALGPFNQQPFLGPRFGTPITSMRRTNAQVSEARDEITLGALTPTYGLPSPAGQALGNLRYLDRVDGPVTAQKLRSPAATTPCPRWQRLGSRRPDGHRALHADGVLKAQFSEPA